MNTPARDPLGCRKTIDLGGGRSRSYYALPELEARGVGRVSRLPVCLRVVLESLARNLDGQRVTEADVRALAGWRANEERTAEIPFVVARVLLQDFTGVPLLVDLGAMRSAVARRGGDPLLIEPVVPVDLVIDHSIQVDHARIADALRQNMEIEFARNAERYAFLKWGRQAFKKLRIVPPGIGIVHQVNLEYLAQGVLETDGVVHFDSLVGTDSHTPMINGLGVVGWGVGGIEAEAGMLGQPVSFLTPDVVGVHMRGALPEGVTATDLVLHVTERLRKANVVGKFVEFHGEGAATLPVPERATISNMSPEYGATIGYFPVDEMTLRYLRATGRAEAQVEALERYARAQGVFGIPQSGDVDYTTVIDVNLADVRAGIAGPRRPQDRIDLPDVKTRFSDLLTRTDSAGYGKAGEEAGRRYREAGAAAPGAGSGPSAGTATMERPAARGAAAGGAPIEIGHGDVVIAAITSCTNTSNPSVMLAAGLLARKAVARGLTVRPTIKTSLAPGSRVVTHYLEKTGLSKDLDALGFNLVGYGCTTCIGNSGPLDPRIEELITRHDVVVASVLSGNRNFEARVHQNVKANFLMSPPLVVAFALAGRVDIDLTQEPLGTDRGGKPVYLREIWPTLAEIEGVMGAALDPEAYRSLYSDSSLRNEWWDRVPESGGTLCAWDAASTYVQEPPYFIPFGMDPEAPAEVVGARPLAIFGDSVTTDHISPAGSIKAATPAGQHLLARGVAKEDFNSYGARRGNHEVMVRGTFANVRIRNQMVPGVEGGVTIHRPSGRQMPIYDAAMEYAREGVPLVVLAGSEYGTGSSRDWAAKGPRLLGVRAVVARSYERIHRSNLVGMGVLPCQFPPGTSAETLRLDGTETFDLVGVRGGVKPRQAAKLIVHRAGGATESVDVTVRVDTPIEAEYFRHGGILPYVLRKLIREGSRAS